MRTLGVLFLAAAASAFAGGIVIDKAPPCGGVATLGDLAGSACTSGPFTMFDVSFQAPLDPVTFEPATPATQAGDIGLFVAFDGSTLSVDFSGNFLYPSNNFTSPEVAEYRIFYTIDPPPPVILGWDEEMDFSEGSGARSTLAPLLLAQDVVNSIEVITLLCVNGSFDGDTCFGDASEQPPPIVLTPGQLFGGVRFRNPSNRVQVIHRILVTEDIQLDLRNSAPVASIPEPSTWVLMGSGALLILLRRRR